MNVARIISILSFSQNKLDTENHGKLKYKTQESMVNFAGIGIPAVPSILILQYFTLLASMIDRSQNLRTFPLIFNNRNE